MTWHKKYRWARTWGNETGLDGKPHEDYTGWDGEVNIGRIFFDQQTLKMGQWRWAIQYPKGGKPYQPNTGWAETSALAAQTVEEMWEKQKAKLGA